MSIETMSFDGIIHTINIILDERKIIGHISIMRSDGEFEVWVPVLNKDGIGRKNIMVASCKEANLAVTIRRKLYQQQ
jgi:hypothetical protein